jgi:hypothetical protein
LAFRFCDVFSFIYNVLFLIHADFGGIADSSFVVVSNVEGAGVDAAHDGLVAIVLSSRVTSCGLSLAIVFLLVLVLWMFLVLQFL